MSDAALKLRQAVHARLTGDAAMVSLLGGPRVHDEAPRAQSGPYVTFDRWSAEDASTPECRMTRHEFDLALFAGESAASARSLAIAARIEALLHDATLTPAGHRVVFLYWRSTLADRDSQTRLPRLTLSFSALTEAS
jgi:Protein of unknown function (DUF3168)